MKPAVVPLETECFLKLESTCKSFMAGAPSLSAGLGDDGAGGAAEALIEAEGTGTMDDQEQEGAGDGDVLPEHDHLGLVGEVGMEDQRRDQGEAGQQEGRDAGLPTD